MVYSVTILPKSPNLQEYLSSLDINPVEKASWRFLDLHPHPSYTTVSNHFIGWEPAGTANSSSRLITFTFLSAIFVRHYNMHCECVLALRTINNIWLENKRNRRNIKREFISDKGRAQIKSEKKLGNFPFLMQTPPSLSQLGKAFFFWFNICPEKDAPLFSPKYSP